jgi:hypothetical protein
VIADADRSAHARSYRASQIAIAAVFIRDTGDQILSLPQMWAAIYGLTAAETCLATQLYEGYSHAHAAGG